MASTKKVKRLKIKIVPIIFLLVIIVGCYFVYQIIIELPITNIYIKGNNILKDQEIIELAKIENYPSFLGTTNSSIKKELMKSPYIKDVEVKKKIWGIVVVEITDNNPLLIDSEGYLVLSDGKRIENVRKITTAVLINYTPDVQYSELLKQLDNLESNMKNKISEIKYEPTDKDKDRFALYMNDGNLVYVTLTKFKKLNYYDNAIKDFTCQKGILNLDSGNHFEIKENVC